MTPVTLFPNAKTTDSPQYLDTADLVGYIRDGKWRAQIERLNSYQYDSPEQREYKRTNLPGIVWQGEFTYRNDKSCTAHSGLVAIDIDHLPPDELVRYRDLITANRYTHILFRSPRGDGLKVIIRIPPSIEDHKSHLAAIGQQYRQHAPKYYDHFDDLSRLCFVSYDPDIYYNPDSEVFTAKARAPTRDHTARVKVNVPEDVQSTFNRIRAWADKGSAYIDTNKHKHLVRVFSACNRYGIPQDDAVRLAYNHYHDTPGASPVSFSDYENRADSVYRLYVADHGTVKFDDDPPAQVTIPAPVIRPPDEPPPPQPGRFPIEVFPGDIPAFIQTLNKSLNYSLDFTAISIMFTIATINGNKVKLKVKEQWIAPTIFWFAAVGEPGTMKSHPISTVIEPINIIDSLSKTEYDHQYEEYEQELAQSKSKTTIRRPVFRQILINDITLESLHEVHSFNRRGLGLYRDELMGFLHDMNRYHKGSDEQFWLESFNNKSYTVNRVSKRPVRIEDTNINIIGTIQPSVFSNLNKNNSGNGLVDRFLYTSAEREIYPMTLNTLDPGWMKWWTDSIMNIHQSLTYLTKDDTVILEMSQQASAKLIEVDTRVCAMQRSDELSDGLKNYLNKYKTYMPRFTLLMALLDHTFTGAPLEVTASHVERANTIMQYFFQSARTIFSEAEKTSEINDVISTRKGMTKSEKILHLHSKGYKNVDIAKMTKVSPVYVWRVIKSKS